MNRRTFLKKSAAASLAVAGAKLLPARVWAGEAPAILPVKNPNSKIQFGFVGCTGIMLGHIFAAKDERLVAFCDCYQAEIDKTIGRVKDGKLENFNPSDLKTYLDYREMLADLGDRLDAVVVCTPDNNHAIIAHDSLKAGKHVLVEKPLCMTIHEAYALRDLARQKRLATQMGNEGHSGPLIRAAVEHLWAGAIGPVHEVYHWCLDRFQGGDDTGVEYAPMKEVSDGYRLWSVPVPEELAFQSLGKSQNPDPFAKIEGGWHADRRYGTGYLGDWSPHTMDVGFWGLKVGEAPTVKIEHVERLYGGTKVHYKMNVFRWTVPARAGMPELKQYWYDGRRPSAKSESPIPMRTESKLPGVPNLPEKVVQVCREHNIVPDGFGSLFVGEKGYMMAGGTSAFGGIYPRELHKATPKPPEVLPRAKGNNDTEWHHAIRTGEASSANFEYSSDFAAYWLLGTIASRLAVGDVFEYDRVKHCFPNRPELDKYLTRAYRKGYEM